MKVDIGLKSINDKDIAWALGLFFADGSCGLYKHNRYGGAGWSITNTIGTYLEEARVGIEKGWPSLRCTIVAYPSEKAGVETNYGIRNFSLLRLHIHPRVRHNDGVRGKVVEEFRQMFYCGVDKQVPCIILESGIDIKRVFLEGAIAGDGKKKGQGRITVKGKLGLNGLLSCMRDCQWSYSIMEYKTKRGIWDIGYGRRREKRATIMNHLVGRGYVRLCNLSRELGLTRGVVEFWARQLIDCGYVVDIVPSYHKRLVKLTSVGEVLVMGKHHAFGI